MVNIYDTYLASFKEYLEVGGKSNAYFNCIRNFLGYSQANNLDITIVSYEEFTKYLLYLKHKNYSDVYINNILSAARGFYHYLLDSGKCTKEQLDIIYKFRRNKTEVKVIDYIDETELEKIIGMAITFISRWDPLRIQALLYFWFYTGIRRGELLNLKREDINLEEGEALIRIPNKTKTERFAIFPNKIIPILKEYFKSEEQDNNAFNLTREKIVYFIKRLNMYLPEKKRLTPHTFRHSFAMMLATKDINVKVAQKMMGHKSLDSTLVYYKPDNRIAKKIYREKVG